VLKNKNAIETTASRKPLFHEKTDKISNQKVNKKLNKYTQSALFIKQGAFIFGP
jgi:hypothetical protein